MRFLHDFSSLASPPHVIDEVLKRVLLSKKLQAIQENNGIIDAGSLHIKDPMDSSGKIQNLIIYILNYNLQRGNCFDQYIAASFKEISDIV